MAKASTRKAETSPGVVASSQVYDTGAPGKRRARTFSQVIAEATRGADAGMNRFTETRPDLSSDRYAPDWRGHYLGKGKSMGNSVEKFVKVEKLDAEHGLVFGWAIICKENGVDYFDVQDDHIPEGAMLKASSEFMAGSRMAKEMHEGGEAGSYLFMWPLTEDIAKAMELTTKRTGLMVGYKPPPAVLAKFKSGEYTGFSIGGTRVKDKEVA